MPGAISPCGRCASRTGTARRGRRARSGCRPCAGCTRRRSRGRGSSRRLPADRRQRLGRQRLGGDHRRVHRQQPAPAAADRGGVALRGAHDPARADVALVGAGDAAGQDLAHRRASWMTTPSRSTAPARPARARAAGPARSAACPPPPSAPSSRMRCAQLVGGEQPRVLLAVAPARRSRGGEEPLELHRVGRHHQEPPWRSRSRCPRRRTRAPTSRPCRTPAAACGGRPRTRPRPTPSRRCGPRRRSRRPALQDHDPQRGSAFFR